MTDLLLVEKVRKALRQIERRTMPHPDDTSADDKRDKGIAHMLAHDALAAMEAHRPPVTVSALYGYEAGLVEGFKQGIEAAAKVVEDAIPMPGSLMQTGTPAQALFIVTKLVRALSPPSIADDGKDGAEMADLPRRVMA